MCRFSRNPGSLTSRTPQGHVGLFRGYFTLPYHIQGLGVGGKIALICTLKKWDGSEWFSLTLDGNKQWAGGWEHHNTLSGSTYRRSRISGLAEKLQGSQEKSVTAHLEGRSHNYSSQAFDKLSEQKKNFRLVQSHCPLMKTVWYCASELDLVEPVWCARQVGHSRRVVPNLGFTVQ
jgi:hypothetical protein